MTSMTPASFPRRFPSALPAWVFSWLTACLVLFPGVGHAQAVGMVEFNTGGFSGQELSGAVQIVLYRSLAGSAFTVELSTRDGSARHGDDYVGTNMVVNFLSGISNRTVTLRLLDDSRFEGVETFTVTLANPTAGVVLVAKCTIAPLPGAAWLPTRAELK